MASRAIMCRRISQVLEARPLRSRMFGSAAALRPDPEEVSDSKMAGRQRQSQQIPRARPPIGLFTDLLPALGRNTSLLQMMDTMEDLFNTPAISPATASRVFQGSNRTPWDVMEDEKAFKLRIDMPGLSKDEVVVDVSEGSLTIKGEHKPVEGEDDWSARSIGSYNMKIKLPENVKVDGIKAELKNGVLRVVAPKVDDVKKRVQIQVN